MSETKKTIPVLSVVFISLSLIIGFFAGLFYQKSKTPSFSRTGQFQMTGTNRSNKTTGNNYGQKNNQLPGQRQTMGEITSLDDSSITVKTADGGSKIVLISDSTTINKATQGSKTDLKVGSKISITGDTNTDGSITGKNININSEIDPTPATKK